MVNLTRIYTKTGDDGSTSLGDMSRTSKNDSRLEAYATVDEANSTIGVVIATDELSDDIRALLVRIQNDLFDVGAHLGSNPWLWFWRKSTYSEVSKPLLRSSLRVSTRCQ